MKIPKGYILVKEEDWNKLQNQVVELQQVIDKLQSRIIELENQLNKNSTNSHKPSSTDVFRKPIQNNREKSNNKQGAQPGHSGTTLTMDETPDAILFHPVEGICECGRDLSKQPILRVERRQVIDLPVKLKEVTEHQIEFRQCECGQVYCGREMDSSPVKYGSKIKALTVYMNNYAHLPYDRLQEFYHDCFDINIADGTLLKANEKCFVNLESTEKQLKDALKSSPLNHSDETGIRCESKLKWIHNTSNDRFTHYAIHDKRGTLAIDDIGILPDYAGVSVHDRYKSYDQYPCEHSLCNAHLLRDLKGLAENGIAWASPMIELLLKAKKYKETLKLTKKLKDEILSEYDCIVASGFVNEPVVPEDPVRKKGRKKKSESLNLLETFENRKDQVLKFFTNPIVPFDNNMAERDLRMVKLKQKISGCFRTKKGAVIFCRIRSYISTLRKQGYSVFASLQLAVDGNPVNLCA